MTITRRKFLGYTSGGLAGAALAGCSGVSLEQAPITAARSAMGVGGNRGKVVVVGGGYGGATAAKYIRMWSDGGVEVTLVEPNEAFVSCPISNLVIGGTRDIGFVTTPYSGLERNHGVKIVRSMATAIDPVARVVTLADGSKLTYDRLVLSPGIDFDYSTLGRMREPEMQSRVLHSWKAGEQTVALRRQLEAMPDGGVFAISIPKAPYRCPPGPYERVCQVADYFKRAKPRSKVLVFDANEKVTSKEGLFKAAWSELYPGIIDYQPDTTAIDIDAAGRELQFEISDPVRADVINLIPPQRAGKIAVDTGLATANARWCEVDFLTFESKAAPSIHVLGDAIQIAPGMPKSGHMANAQAKVAAAAIVNLLAGKEPSASPVVTNTCYSFVSADEVVHVASVHQFDDAKRTFLPVEGAGGLSASRNRLEAITAIAWAKNIWADTLA